MRRFISFFAMCIIVHVRNIGCMTDTTVFKARHGIDLAACNSQLHVCYAKERENDTRCTPEWIRCTYGDSCRAIMPYDRPVNVKRCEEYARLHCGNKSLEKSCSTFAGLEDKDRAAPKITWVKTDACRTQSLTCYGKSGLFYRKGIWQKDFANFFCSTRHVKCDFGGECVLNSTEDRLRIRDLCQFYFANYCPPEKIANAINSCETETGLRSKSNAIPRHTIVAVLICILAANCYALSAVL